MHKSALLKAYYVCIWAFLTYLSYWFNTWLSNKGDEYYKYTN